MTTTLRLPLVSLPKETMPSISVMTANSFGLRASNSSATRGRPPVMSLVLVVSRGILAMTSPALDLVALGDHDVGAHRQEVAGRRPSEPGSFGVLPCSSLMEMRGRASASLDSMMTLRGQAGDLVDLLLHGHAFDDVAELHRAGDLGEDRDGVGVPLGEQVAGLDLLALARP